MSGWIKVWRERRIAKQFADGYGYVMMERFLNKRTLGHIRGFIAAWEGPYYEGARAAIASLEKANHRQYELYSRLASVGLLDSQIEGRTGPRRWASAEPNVQSRAKRDDTP